METLDETLEFGGPFVIHVDGPAHNLAARIKILDESFWVRVFLHPDFGFAGNVF